MALTNAMPVTNHIGVAGFAELYSVVKESSTLKVNWNEELKADSNQ